MNLCQEPLLFLMGDWDILYAYDKSYYNVPTIQMKAGAGWTNIFFLGLYI